MAHAFENQLVDANNETMGNQERAKYGKDREQKAHFKQTWEE